MARHGDEPPAVGMTPPDARSASARTALLPLAVIVASLLAILVVPILHTGRTEQLRRDLREVTEPARRIEVVMVAPSPKGDAGVPPHDARAP